MFNLLPPLDVSDPQAFIAGTIAIFASYPVEVMQAAVDPTNGIPGRTDRPTLKTIKAVCEEIYAPIERRIERERAAEEHRRALPPPRVERTPEQQARIEASVAELKRKLASPPPEPVGKQRAADGQRKPIVIAPDAKRPSDLTRAELDAALGVRPDHAIAADMAEQSARRLQSTEGCGND